MARNSLGDLIQAPAYLWRGQDEWQCFQGEVKYETLGLNDHEFEHIYHIDMMDPSGGFLPRILQVGINDSSLELQSKLDAECAQLVED